MTLRRGLIWGLALGLGILAGCGTNNPIAPGAPAVRPARLAQNVVYPADLAAYWSFDEGAGTTFADPINANTGTFYDNTGATNGPSWAPGVVGSSVSFHGLGEYAMVWDNASLNPPQQITCEEWIKLAADAPAWGTALMEKGGWNGGQSGYCFLVGYWGMANTVRFEVFSPWRLLDSVTSLPVNQWVHVAATYDGAEMKIYINGQLNSSAPVTGPININNTGVLGMAARFTRTGANGNEFAQAFFGQMDEAAVYGRALTAEEIRNHYQNGLRGLSYFASAGRVKAAIKLPREGKRVDKNRVLVMAEITAGDPRDVAKVLFEGRCAGAAAWQTLASIDPQHPNPDATRPYFIFCNGANLPDGEYQIRAVAFDRDLQPDPDPAYIQVRAGGDPDHGRQGHGQHDHGRQGGH